MMIVVPLAGPDFERGDGAIKAESIVDGVPLLRRGLEGRSWWRRGSCQPSDLVFVLRDTPGSRAFATRSLDVWYSGARLVWLSDATQGAALSALAGVATIAHRPEPLCVDLCDIFYTEEVEPVALFDRMPKCGGIGLVFQSSHELYSYFRFDAAGRCVETAEKRVISRVASAGTYWFRSPSIYLSALAHNLETPAEVTFRELFYVCPVFNGVLANGLDVWTEEVKNVRDVKLAPV